MSWENAKQQLHCPIVYTPSPNFNARPLGVSIQSIIIHYTDFFTSQDSLDCLCDPKKQVSAHFFIDRDGTLHEMVDPLYRAWHAGVSQWQDVHNLNDISIGIELQNGGFTHFQKYMEWEPYPDALMKTLIELINALSCAFPIQKEWILGHNDIAPDRKIDPGPHFDWQLLRKEIKLI